MHRYASTPVRRAAHVAILVVIGCLAAPLAHGQSGASLPGAATPNDARLLGRVVEALAAGKTKRGAHTTAIGGVLDPRSVTVLRYLATHENDQPIAIAAVRGLARLAASGRIDAIAALESVVRAERRAAVAEAGLIALGGLAPSPDAYNALMRIAADGAVAQARRKVAIAQLRKHYPKRVAGAELPRLSGPAVLPTIGGAWAGGYLLTVLGRFAKDDSAETIGALSGALIGGGTGYLFGREATLDRQAWYLSSILWGQFTGEFVALSVLSNPTERARGAFGVGGEIAGFLGGVLFEDALDLDAGDVAFVDVTGIAGFMLGGGLTQLIPAPRDRKAGAQLMLATAWLGAAAAVAANPYVKLRGPDIYLQAYGAAEGMYFGSFLGDILTTTTAEKRDAIFQDRSLTPAEQNKQSAALEDDQTDPEVGGMLVGGAIGYGIATAVSQQVKLRAGDVTQLAVFTQYGKVLGAGLAFLGKFEEDATNGMQLGFGLLGMGVAALTVDDLKFRGGDRALIPLATFWGLFHGGAIAEFLDQKNKLKDAQGAGFVFTSGAAFGIAAMAATQDLELTNLEATMASTGAFWGAWLGFWTGTRLKSKTGTTLLASAIGGDVGAAITGVLISDYVGLDPLVLAGASFGGLTFAGVGTLLALMATDDSDALITTNIAGSVVGMAVGGLAANYYVSKRSRRGGSKRASVDDGDDFDLPAWFAGFNASPIVRENGYEGMTLNLAGRW